LASGQSLGSNEGGNGASAGAEAAQSKTPKKSNCPKPADRSERDLDRKRPEFDGQTRDSITLGTRGGGSIGSTDAGLSVDLAQGENALLFTLTNADNSTSGKIAYYSQFQNQGYFSVDVSLQLQLEFPSGQTSLGKPFQQRYNLAPGDTVMRPFPGTITGPGRALLIASNKGAYTTTVTLQRLALGCTQTH
jgi:hypothetical protein